MWGSNFKIKGLQDQIRSSPFLLTPIRIQMMPHKIKTECFLVPGAYMAFLILIVLAIATPSEPIEHDTRAFGNEAGLLEYPWIDCTNILDKILSTEDNITGQNFEIIYEYKYLEESYSKHYYDQYNMPTLDLNIGVHNTESGELVEFDSVAIIIPNLLKYLTAPQDHLSVAANFLDEEFGETLHCFRPLNSILLISNSKYNPGVYSESGNTNAEVFIYNLPPFGMTLEVYVRFRIVPQNLIVHDLLTFEITDSEVPSSTTSRNLMSLENSQFLDSTVQVPFSQNRRKRETGLNESNSTHLTTSKLASNLTEESTKNFSYNTNSPSQFLQQNSNFSGNSDNSISNVFFDDTTNDSTSTFLSEMDLDFFETETEDTSRKMKRDLKNVKFRKGVLLPGLNDEDGSNRTLDTRSSRLLYVQHRDKSKLKKEGKRKLQRNLFEMTAESDIGMKMKLERKSAGALKMGHRRFHNKTILQQQRAEFANITHIRRQKIKNRALLRNKGLPNYKRLSARRGHHRSKTSAINVNASSLFSKKSKSKKLDPKEQLVSKKRGHIRRIHPTVELNSTNASDVGRSGHRRKGLLNLKRDRKLNPKLDSRVAKSIRSFSENLKNPLLPQSQNNTETSITQLKRGHIRHRINHNASILGDNSRRRSKQRASRQNLTHFLQGHSIVAKKRGHHLKVLDKTKPWGRTLLLSKEDTAKLERMSSLLGLKRGHVSIKKNGTRGMGRHGPSEIDPRVDFEVSQRLVQRRRGHKRRHPNITALAAARTSARSKKRKVGADARNLTTYFLNASLISKKRGHVPKKSAKKSFGQGQDTDRVAIETLIFGPSKIRKISQNREAKKGRSKPHHTLIKLRRGHSQISKKRGNDSVKKNLVSKKMMNREIMDPLLQLIPNDTDIDVGEASSKKKRQSVVSVKRGLRRMSSSLARTVNNRNGGQGQGQGGGVQVVAQFDSGGGSPPSSEDYIDSPKLMRKGFSKKVVERYGKDRKMNVDSVFTGCGTKYSCFHFPAGCHKKKVCYVGMAYELHKGESVKIKLVATTISYVAVAFSKDTYMGSDAVIICKRAPGGSRVGIWEAYNTDAQGFFDVSETISQTDHKNVEIDSSHCSHGILSCTFTLPLQYSTESGIQMDFKGHGYYALLAVGTSNVEPNGHGSIAEPIFGIKSSKALNFDSPNYIVDEGKSHYLVTVHICLGILSYCLFMPFAILMARYGQQAYPYKSIKDFPKWVVIHIGFQLTAVILNVVTLVVIYIGRTGSSFTTQSGVYHFIICPIFVVGSVVNVAIGFKIHQRKVGKEMLNPKLKKTHYAIGHLSHFFGALEMVRGTYLPNAFVACSFPILAGYLFLFYAFAHVLLLFNTDYLRRVQKNTEPLARAFIGPAIHLDVYADREQYDVRRGTLVFMMFIFLLFTVFLLVVVYSSGRNCGPDDPAFIYSLL